jgi:hypothetical protein
MRMLLLFTMHIAVSLVLLPLAAAKQGASTNYSLPLILSLSPLGGIVVSRVFVAARNRRRCDLAVLCGVSLILLASQPMLIAAPRILSPRYTDDQEIGERRALIGIVRSSPGTVYSEDLLLLLQAGKDIFAEPAIITALSEAAQWDEQPLLDMFARKAFPLNHSTS